MLNIWRKHETLLGILAGACETRVLKAEETNTMAPALMRTQKGDPYLEMEMIRIEQHPPWLQAVQNVAAHVGSLGLAGVLNGSNSTKPLAVSAIKALSL